MKPSEFNQYLNTLEAMRLDAIYQTSQSEPSEGMRAAFDSSTELQLAINRDLLEYIERALHPTAVANIERLLASDVTDDRWDQ